MKKLILVILLFALAPLPAVAQSPIEREIEQLGLKGVSFTISSPDPTPGLREKAAKSTQFSVDLTHVDVSVVSSLNNDTNITVHGRITNLTDAPLSIGFVRQQSLPDQWISSICFGMDCYANWVDATVAQQPWQPNETRELVLQLKMPANARGNGDIRVALYSPGSGDTVIVTYAASAKPAAPAFSVDFSHVDVSILPNTDKDTNVTIHANITNLTDAPLQLGFVRQQQLAHPHWKSAVCFGINCYADWVSATVSNEPWAPNETRELVMHIRTPPGAQGTGDIRLALYAPSTGDTVVVTYKATMEPVPVVQCRTFWFDNPYDGDVKIREVYVENPDLFDVEVMSDTSYEIFNKDIISVRFCLKKTDEAQYSTNVVFVTDSGTFKQEFTMQTPSAGVSPIADNASGIRILSVSPNPAAASQFVQVNLESSRNGELTFAIVDLLGREIHSVSTYAGAGSFGQKLSIADLPAGSYMVLVRENGVVLDQASFNITR